MFFLNYFVRQMVISLFREHYTTVEFVRQMVISLFREHFPMVEFVRQIAIFLFRERKEQSAGSGFDFAATGSLAGSCTSQSIFCFPAGLWITIWSRFVPA
ncbi:MAG: hypothetical protein KAT71_01270 [Gammaproteobacteria bacterium]|nr:hypothetical protein [Gammaproteobacteria bacterium]